MMHISVNMMLLDLSTYSDFLSQILFLYSKVLLSHAFLFYLKYQVVTEGPFVTDYKNSDFDIK
jgi:hypothetical protein